MPLMGDMVASAKSVSKRLIAAYVFDWIALAGIAAIAAGIANITPHFHAFSLVDLSISYPYVEETISSAVLAVVGGIIPAIIIFVVVMLFVPGPATWRSMSRMSILRWKLWEWNAGWLGLAMTHAISQLLVQGTKNVAGKPRPDCLARCIPDMNRVAEFTVGGYGQDISPNWVLVDQRICTQTDSVILDDGFRSFPSGHAATSWAGMIFLSLYLASKFSIWFPLLPMSGSQGDMYHKQRKESRQVVYRDEGAAAPTWLLFLVAIPIGIAVYITGTRFFEYYHFGFDLISGALIGIVSAWFSFRWYNLPLGRSAGWAWGPRSRDRAFGIGVGSYGFVTDATEPLSDSGITPNKVSQSRPTDVEMGPMSNRTQQRNGWPQRTGQYQEVGSSAGDVEPPGTYHSQYLNKPV